MSALTQFTLIGFIAISFLFWSLYELAGVKPYDKRSFEKKLNALISDQDWSK